MDKFLYSLAFISLLVENKWSCQAVSHHSSLSPRYSTARDSLLHLQCPEKGVPLKGMVSSSLASNCCKTWNFDTSEIFLPENKRTYSSIGTVLSFIVPLQNTRADVNIKDASDWKSTELSQALRVLCGNKEKFLINSRTPHPFFHQLIANTGNREVFSTNVLFRIKDPAKQHSDGRTQMPESH